MSADSWPIIHAERASLADDLTSLSDEQWHTRSLCSDWDVHQVLAHLLSAAKMTPPRFFARFASAGFRFNRYAQREVDREGAGGPAATLTAFRAASRRSTSPPGPKATWLGEVLVHSEDIRRPLGIPHTYPPGPAAQALEFYSSSNAIIGGRDRVAGLTLAASDSDVHIGSGPVVEGPLISLLLAASGRSTSLGELSGPGVPVLAERLRTSGDL